MADCIHQYLALEGGQNSCPPLTWGSWEFRVLNQSLASIALLVELVCGVKLAKILDNDLEWLRFPLISLCGNSIISRKKEVLLQVNLEQKKNP